MNSMNSKLSNESIIINGEVLKLKNWLNIKSFAVFRLCSIMYTGRCFASQIHINNLKMVIKTIRNKFTILLDLIYSIFSVFIAHKSKSLLWRRQKNTKCYVFSLTSSNTKKLNNYKEEDKNINYQLRIILQLKNSQNFNSAIFKIIFQKLILFKLAVVPFHLV